MFRNALALAALSLAACSTAVDPNENTSPGVGDEAPAAYNARINGAVAASDTAVTVQLTEIGERGQLIALSTSDLFDDGSFTLSAPANTQNLVVVAMDIDGNIISSGFLDRTNADDSDNFIGLINDETHVETLVHIQLLRDERSEADIDHNEIRARVDAKVAAAVDSDGDIHALSIGFAALFEAETRAYSDSGIERSQAEWNQASTSATLDLIVNLADGMSHTEANDRYIDAIGEIEAELGVDAWLRSEADTRASLALRLAVAGSTSSQDQDLVDAIGLSAGQIEASTQLDIANLLDRTGDVDAGMSTAVAQLIDDLDNLLSPSDTDQAFDTYRDAVGQEDSNALRALLQDLLGSSGSSDGEGLESLLDQLLGGNLTHDDGLLGELLNILNNDDNPDNDGIGGLIDTLFGNSGTDSGLLDDLLGARDSGNPGNPGNQGLLDELLGSDGILSGILSNDGERSLLDVLNDGEGIRGDNGLLGNLLGGDGLLGSLLDGLFGGGSTNPVNDLVDDLLENNQDLVQNLLGDNDEQLLREVLRSVLSNDGSVTGEATFRTVEDLVDSLLDSDDSRIIELLASNSEDNLSGTLEELLDEVLDGGNDGHVSDLVDSLIDSDNSVINNLLGDNDESVVRALLENLLDREDGDTNESNLLDLGDLISELQVALALQIAIDAGDDFELSLELAVQAALQSDSTSAADRAALWAGIATETYVDFASAVRDQGDAQGLDALAIELATAVQATYRGQRSSL